MHQFQSILFAVMFIAAALWLPGCSDATQGDQSTRSNSETSSLPAESAGVLPPESSAAKPSLQGLCPLLPPADLASAFGNKFESPISGWGEHRMCQYDIPEYGGHIVFNVLNRGYYDIYKAQREAAIKDPRFELRYLDGLGQEAVIFHNSQAQVLLDDDGFMLITLTLTAAGESPITPEEASAALEQLARTVVARL